MLSRLRAVARLSRRTGLVPLTRPLSGTPSLKSPNDAAEPPPERFSSRTKRDNKIRYYVISNQAASALRLLEQTVFRVPIIDAASGREKFLRLPPATVCNKVLDCAAQERPLIVRAAELADALLLQGMALEAKTLRSLALGLAGTGRLEASLPFLDRWLATELAESEEEQEEGSSKTDADDDLDDNMRRPAPRYLQRALSWLLECAAREGSTQNMVAVLSRAARAQVVPSAQSVTAVVAACARAGEPAKARAVLSWMRRHDLHAGPAQHTAALSQPEGGLRGAEATALVKAAEDAAREMAEDGIEPDPAFFAAWLRACGSAYDIKAAQRVLAEAQAFGVGLDDRVLAAFFGVCAKTGDAQTAVRVLESVTKNDNVDANGTSSRPLGRGAQEAVLQALERAAPGVIPDRPGLAEGVWKRFGPNTGSPTLGAAAAYMALLLADGKVTEALKLVPVSSSLEPSSVASPAASWLFRAAERSRTAAWDWEATAAVARAAHAARALSSPADVVTLIWATALRAVSRADPAAANLPAWVLYQQEDAPLVMAPSSGRRVGAGARQPGTMAAAPLFQASSSSTSSSTETTMPTSSNAIPLSKPVFDTCILAGLEDDEGSTASTESSQDNVTAVLDALQRASGSDSSATSSNFREALAQLKPLQPLDRLAAVGRLAVIGKTAEAFDLVRMTSLVRQPQSKLTRWTVVGGTGSYQATPTWPELRCLVYAALRESTEGDTVLANYLLPVLKWKRELPREPAGAWWDERVERTLLHTLKRASKAGADQGDVAAGRELLSSGL